MDRVPLLRPLSPVSSFSDDDVANRRKIETRRKQVLLFYCRTEFNYLSECRRGDLRELEL